MKLSVFVGVDVAGEKRTWVAALRLVGGSLELVEEPKPMSLEAIVRLCEEQEAIAVALDAPLTAALTDKNGRRSADEELASLLPHGSHQWVMSANSMMAVPFRGQLLAEALSPIVGTILETHPRACLFFASGPRQHLRDAVDKYKGRGSEATKDVELLWGAWVDRFKIRGTKTNQSHDALDSLVCATVAYLYHAQPEALRRLVHKAVKRYGRGPFFVLAPEVFEKGYNPDAAPDVNRALHGRRR